MGAPDRDLICDNFELRGISEQHHTNYLIKYAIFCDFVSSAFLLESIFCMKCTEPSQGSVGVRLFGRCVSVADYQPFFEKLGCWDNQKLMTLLGQLDARVPLDGSHCCLGKHFFVRANPPPQGGGEWGGGSQQPFSNPQPFSIREAGPPPGGGSLRKALTPIA